jgi:hypothetical protein
VFIDIVYESEAVVVLVPGLRCLVHPIGVCCGLWSKGNSGGPCHYGFGGRLPPYFEFYHGVGLWVNAIMVLVGHIHVYQVCGGPVCDSYGGARLQELEPI